MAIKVNFDLKKPNSTGKYNIYLVYRYDRKKLVYPTGEAILEKFWNEKTQRLREGREQPENKDINQYLDKIESSTKLILIPTLLSSKVKVILIEKRFD